MVQHTIHARAVSRLSLDYKVCRHDSLCQSVSSLHQYRSLLTSKEGTAQYRASGTKYCSKVRLTRMLPESNSSTLRYTTSLSLHAIPAKGGKVRPADTLQEEAAKFLPLVRLARSKQDPINRGHGAQYLHRPPASRGRHTQYTQIKSLRHASTLCSNYANVHPSTYTAVDFEN